MDILVLNGGPQRGVGSLLRNITPLDIRRILQSSKRGTTSANDFMACLVMACLVMACLVMACLVMACASMACSVMAYTVMAQGMKDRSSPALASSYVSFFRGETVRYKWATSEGGRTPWSYLDKWEAFCR